MLILRPPGITFPSLRDTQSAYVHELPGLIGGNFNQLEQAFQTLYSEAQYLRAVISIIADRVNLCEGCPDRYKRLTGECQYCSYLDNIVREKYGI